MPSTRREPDIEHNPRDCLQAIYDAVGTGSIQGLSRALESPVMPEALLDMARDNHNPVTLAATCGDERLLELFRQHGVLLHGWYGAHQMTLLHALAEDHPSDTQEAEQWLLDHCAGSHLFHAKDGNDKQPIQMLIEHCRGTRQDADRLIRWIHAASVAPRKPLSHMFSRLAKTRLIDPVRLGEDPAIADPGEVPDLWAALATNRHGWSDVRANALLSAGLPAPADLLSRWEQAASRIHKQRPLKERTPHKDNNCGPWLLANGVDPTLTDDRGLTVMERALLAFDKPFAGWESGVACALDLRANYAYRHEIEVMAPRLPQVLSLLALREGLRGSLSFQKLSGLWNTASQLPAPDLPVGVPSPATHKFKDAARITLTRLQREALCQDIELALHTSSTPTPSRPTPRL